MIPVVVLEWEIFAAKECSDRKVLGVGRGAFVFGFYRAAATGVVSCRFSCSRRTPLSRGQAGRSCFAIARNVWWDVAALGTGDYGNLSVWKRHAMLCCQWP